MSKKDLSETFYIDLQTFIEHFETIAQVPGGIQKLRSPFPCDCKFR